MRDMEITRSLVAFVGMRDPYPESEEEEGPILALLVERLRQACPFDEAWLLCPGAEFFERAADLRRAAAEEGVPTLVRPVDFPLKDVIDYAEIWSQLGRSLASIASEAGEGRREWTFLLDSGTPQMKTCLFLASRSGLFPAALVQGIPPRFAGGAYKAREVRLEGLPEIRLPCRPASMGALGDADRALPGTVSPAYAEALRMARSAARYDDPVLLLGETGTGKTMIARRVHEASPRAGRPFVEVNCSAIVASMAESELFGHSRGAFTGAEKARSGRFRAADGGTLFLDEVGDLSLEVQAKLLKALEDRRVTPVGSDKPEEADVRLVAATNRDLPAMIAGGSFRRDLYERIKVVTIRLPPLRERRGEIRPLAERFLAERNASYGERRSFSEEALSLLEAYSWPGNVRELRNAVQSSACAALCEVLGPESLPVEVREASRARGPAPRARSSVELPPEGLDLRARMLQLEWQYVAEALRRTGGNREAAAELLGMTGHAFRKALRERFAGFVDEGGAEGMC